MGRSSELGDAEGGVTARIVRRTIVELCGAIAESNVVVIACTVLQVDHHVVGDPGRIGMESVVGHQIVGGTAVLSRVEHLDRLAAHRGRYLAGELGLDGHGVGIVAGVDVVVDRRSHDVGRRAARCGTAYDKVRGSSDGGSGVVVHRGCVYCAAVNVLRAEGRAGHVITHGDVIR